jgi:RNA-directed DNA polymerase
MWVGTIGSTIAATLASKLLSVPWTFSDQMLALTAVLGNKRRPTIRRLLTQLEIDQHRYPPSPKALAQLLLACRSFQTATQGLRDAPWLLRPTLSPPLFLPADRFSSLSIPRLVTPGDLALWLDISLDHLDWFAGTRRPHDPTMIPVLQHYSYIFIPRRRGPPRLIESPKPRLKVIQRRILDEILAFVPAHNCSHGFVRGRSALSGAQIHAGDTMVVAFDLANFFASTPLRRVHGLLRSLGYPWAVARALTGLVSTSTPEAVFRRRPKTEVHTFETVKTFAARHLPQGAPTSPALANLCAWPLDQRLVGLAGSVGASYTRYADDLTFSGDATFARRAPVLLRAVAEITSEEGYRLNPLKTRVMPANSRQTVTGIVVNAHLNIARDDYDALKATLHNCKRFGPADQNHHGVPDLRAHLDGRVGWVEQLNRQRGMKLRAMFADIEW